MTSKTLTFRVPVKVHQRLAEQAAQEGLHLSSYLRRVLQRDHDVANLELIRLELLAKLEHYFNTPLINKCDQTEVLHLVRAIANYLSPQLTAQVKSRLATKKSMEV